MKTKEPPGSKKAQSALHEIDEIVRRSGKALVQSVVILGLFVLICSLLKELLIPADFFLTHIGRVRHDNVELFTQSEHPFGIEKICRCVLVEWIPAGYLLRCFFRQVVGLGKQVRQFLSQLIDLLLRLNFRAPIACPEITFVGIDQLFLGHINFRITKEIGLSALNGPKRISRDQPRFEVRQRSDVQIIRRLVDLLADDQRDEEAQLGDLHGDRLDVDAMDAFVDDIELAGIIREVAGFRKVFVQFVELFLVPRQRLWVQISLIA
jgi:hypothetical protein